MLVAGDVPIFPLLIKVLAPVNVDAPPDRVAKVSVRVRVRVRNNLKVRVRYRVISSILPRQKVTESNPTPNSNTNPNLIEWRNLHNHQDKCE
jgi:hypothetical protein